MNTFSSRHEKPRYERIARQKNSSRRGHTPPATGRLPPAVGHPSTGRDKGRMRARDTTPVDASSTPPLTGAFMSALFALPFTVLLGVIFLLVITTVAYNNPDPEVLISPLSLVALGLTALLGGLIAARRGRGAPRLSGLLCGLMLNLLLLVLTLCWGQESKDMMTMGYPVLVKWGIHVAILLLSLLGAKLGSRRR